MTASALNVANNHFDFIVVGAGASGLTLAAQLARNSKHTVLVLENGPGLNNDPNILRPLASVGLLGNNQYTYAYPTTKQPHTLDRVHVWHRGKGVGGSSAVNFSVYMPPPADDIDDFEKLGNSGFNWSNFSRALRKVEGFVRPRDENLVKGNLKASKWTMGTEGPLKISYPPTVTILESKMQEALTYAGITAASDPQGGDPHGHFITPNTYDPISHTRSYATTAFYEPNKHLPNFTVLPAAQVQRVLFSSSSNGGISASGVEFVTDGTKYTVHAAKEVIISCGALASPQLLELSGIGNKKILDNLGVPVVIDLPAVGENLQEHGMVRLSAELKPHVQAETFDALLDPVQAAKHIELHATGTGLFTQGIIGFSLLTLDDISKQLRMKMRESILKKWDTYSPSLQHQYKIQLDRLERSLEMEIATYPGLNGSDVRPGKRHVSLTTLLMHPFSRGTVHSISNDINDPPECDPRLFDEEIDLELMVETLSFAKKLFTSPPMKDTLAEEIIPGPNVQTEEQLRDYVRKMFITSWHTSSSCSMLPRDKGGVVDPNFKVYGTTNLRVVDMSVIPLQVAAHTQATAYGIGAYASEVILGTV
ncbi:hypothetical protein EIP91_012127 [Steccherinum ochraceum]|uniref:Glucose-methanol-choline oxidoreductase N-terminal domain-containing protein n=1 Tax=Steccherinum ochraceum TaxID=92696 RepID=A0A4R0S1K5_9APHY|nr:hypothetical protein EIP91_012127 [Steccherinum ochraceum]